MAVNEILDLKCLKLISDNIKIKTDIFPGKSLFSNHDPEIWIWGLNFSKWILKEIPKVVPIFEGMLIKTQLTRDMSDFEILGELGYRKLFTVSEFLAIIHELTSKQPNGEDGLLANDESDNIFYIKLEERRVIVVHISWHRLYRKWILGALDLYDWHQRDGCCVFSHS